MLIWVLVIIPLILPQFLFLHLEVFKLLLQNLHIANLDYVFRLDYKLKIKQINYCPYYDY